MEIVIPPVQALLTVMKTKKEKTGMNSRLRPSEVSYGSMTLGIADRCS
jgi:hypothetical protein